MHAKCGTPLQAITREVPFNEVSFIHNMSLSMWAGDVSDELLMLSDASRVCARKRYFCFALTLHSR